MSCFEYFSLLLEWNEIYIEKIEMKTRKPKKMGLKWCKTEQSWRVNNWMKVIFSDESGICINRGDDVETFVFCRSNETCKDD